MNDTDLPGPRELLLKGLLKRWVTLKVRGLSLAEFGYMVRCVAYSIRIYLSICLEAYKEAAIVASGEAVQLIA